MLPYPRYVDDVVVFEPLDRGIPMKCQSHFFDRILAAFVVLTVFWSVVFTGQDKVVTGTDLAEVVDEVLIDDVSPAPDGNKRQQDLRSQYLKLIQKKAELLNLDELQREIKSMQHDIRELEANRQLNEAVQKLELLIDEFPHARAADVATRMLKIRSSLLMSDPNHDPELSVPQPVYEETIRHRETFGAPPRSRTPQPIEER